MKKIFALLLVVAMVVSMAACSGNDGGKDASVGPDSALAALEKIWGLYGEDDKFPIMGGDYEAMVDGAPGKYDMAQKESLCSQLHLPEDQMDNIDEAATMIHMMNANTFSCGVLHLTSGVNVAEYAKALRDSIQATQWMCGFPDKLLIAGLGGQYVLVAFGGESEDWHGINTLEAKLKEAYSSANVLYSEAIA